MPNNAVRKLIYTCVKCQSNVLLSDIQKQKLKYASPTLWCHDCKEFTVHKEASFFAKEKDALLFKEIFGDNIASMSNVAIQCEMGNGLFFLSQTVNEIADFVLQNKLTIDKRDYILNSIRNVLNNKAKSVYGLKFRYVYRVLYDNYCYEPVGYCRHKGCYLSESDKLEKDCSLKKCKSFVEKK